MKSPLHVVHHFFTGFFVFIAAAVAYFTSCRCITPVVRVLARQLEPLRLFLHVFPRQSAQQFARASLINMLSTRTTVRPVRLASAQRPVVYIQS